MNNIEPIIYNIKHFSLDDGPGIRTTVFFKGCKLNCKWCHNPESIKIGKELFFEGKRCIKCYECSWVCKQNAISFTPMLKIDKKKCILCEECAGNCPALALKIIGKYYLPEELAEIILRDRNFYNTSNGGVTFSGGEPTLYIEYLNKVMKILKNENIHIAIQTCGLFDLKIFLEKLVPYIDLIFYDIKIINSELHKKFTRQSNNKILNNFIYLYKNTPVKIIPRTPLIPGITDTKENISQIRKFLYKTDCKEWNVLRYNPVNENDHT